jgi:hypothetical protein
VFGFELGDEVLITYYGSTQSFIDTVRGWNTLTGNIYFDRCPLSIHYSRVVKIPNTATPEQRKAIKGLLDERI